MADPLKISQFDPKILEDNDVFVVAVNGENYSVTGLAIKDYISGNLESTTFLSIEPNVTEQKIPIVAYSESPCFFVKYYTKRDTRMSAGQFLIMAYNSSAAQLVELGKGTYPNDFEATGGIEFNAPVIESNIIKLVVSTDNDDSENTEFYYKITML
jgi:hypothetical protein